MPTEKRERQRANRAAKQAVEAKVQRRKQIVKRARQLAILIVVMLAFAVVLSLFTGNDADTETETAPPPAVTIVV